MLEALSTWFATWFGHKPLALPTGDIVTQRWDDLPSRPGGRVTGAVAAWPPAGEDIEWQAAIARAKARAIDDTATPLPEVTPTPVMGTSVTEAALASLRAVQPPPPPPARRSPPARPAIVLSGPMRAVNEGQGAPRIRSVRPGN
jgi:hypothetical protein